MGFKLAIDRLTKAELLYELQIRGCTLDSTQTVVKLRVALRKIIKDEAAGIHPSRPATHPFAFADDYAAVNALKGELTDLLKSYTDAPDKNIAQTIETKFTHGLARLEASIPAAADDSALKETLFVELSLLISRFELARTRINVNIKLDPDMPSPSAAPGRLSTPSTSGASPNIARRVAAASVVVSPPSVPVAKWNLSFTGDSRILSLSAFLERVNELSRARNVSKSQLFAEACDLFGGKALVWFRANVSLANTWDELVALLRSEFQPVDYDSRLLIEIQRRTQGADETVGIFVAVMKNLFSRLSQPLPEDRQLNILLRNITPFYQTQLGLIEVRSIPELIAYGRRIEERQYAVESYVPPSRKRSDLEIDLAYVDMDPPVSSVPESISEVSVATSRETPGQTVPDTRPRFKSLPTRPAAANPPLCWNCGNPNHRAGQCPEPRSKIYCYRCGKPDVTVNTCPKCGKSNSQVPPGNGSRDH